MVMESLMIVQPRSFARRSTQQCILARVLSGVPEMEMKMISRGHIEI
jgi:hypothetical protein